MTNKEKKQKNTELNEKEIAVKMIEESEKEKEQMAEKEFEKEIEVKFRKDMTREEREEESRKRELESWIPKTKVGKLVKSGKLKNMEEILEKYKILEPQIVDTLLDLKSDLLLIGQSKGKFGGGKRRAWRQTQKKTAEGNVPTFSSMVIVGDGNGYIGIGYGRAKETLPAREKALRYAKLNIIKIERGCGSFDCLCKEKHSIPFKVEGRNGSVKIVLFPAPQGTGLVVADEVKKILKLVGIKDVYSKTFGKTNTTMNLAKATIDALNNIKLKSRKVK